jgi:hypothetical protein
VVVVSVSVVVDSSASVVGYDSLRAVVVNASLEVAVALAAIAVVAEGLHGPAKARGNCVESREIARD